MDTITAVPVPLEESNGARDPRIRGRPSCVRPGSVSARPPRASGRAPHPGPSHPPTGPEPSEAPVTEHARTLPAPRPSTLGFDPAAERDACGIGFVANVDGQPRRSIVEMALRGLCGVKHRGAVAADARSGDGAGVLTQIPRELVATWALQLAGAPVDAARTGLAMLFLQAGEDEAAEAARDTARAAFAAACEAEGVELVGFRDLPTVPAAIGEMALAAQPALVQAVLLRPEGADDPEAERVAYRVRRRARKACEAAEVRFYAASCSFLTVTYKAMADADQLHPLRVAGSRERGARLVACTLRLLVPAGLQEQHRQPGACGIDGHTCQLQGPLRHQLAGDLGEYPGAVPGARVGRHRTAVLDPAQPPQGHVDDAAAGLTIDVGDETDAAGVALGGGVEPQGGCAGCGQRAGVLGHRCLRRLRARRMMRRAGRDGEHGR